MFHNGVEFLPSYLPAIYVSWMKEPRIKQGTALVAACEGVGYALGQVWAIRLDSRGRKPTLLRCHDVSITLSLPALITWVGLRLVDWMVFEKRHRSEEFLFDIRERFESASAFGSY